MIEKRFALELTVLNSETFNENDDGSVESVVPSVCIGQFARLLELVDDSPIQSITDDEYTRYVISEGKRFQYSFEIITLLKSVLKCIVIISSEGGFIWCLSDC